jgi:hypothetical protein
MGGRFGFIEPRSDLQDDRISSGSIQKMKRRGVQDSSIRQHSQGLDGLCENHTNMDYNQAFGPEFATPVAAAVARPTIRVTAAVQGPGGEMQNSSNRISNAAVATPAVRVAAAGTGPDCEMQNAWDGMSDGTEDPNDMRTSYQMGFLGKQSKRRKGTKLRRKMKSRCRRCGHEFASEQWKAYHKQEYSPKEDEPSYSRCLPNINDRRVWKSCTVPEESICLLFQNFDYNNMKMRLPRKRCKGCEACNVGCAN